MFSCAPLLSRLSFWWRAADFSTFKTMQSKEQIVFEEWLLSSLFVSCWLHKESLRVREGMSWNSCNERSLRQILLFALWLLVFVRVREGKCLWFCNLHSLCKGYRGSSIATVKLMCCCPVPCRQASGTDQDGQLLTWVAGLQKGGEAKKHSSVPAITS